MQKEKSMSAAEILKQAQELVNGSRQADYGHPRDNHGCTAVFWSAFLTRRVGAQKKPYALPIINSRDVCRMMMLQKISRDANSPKDDNLVDIIGYALNAAMLDEDREA